MPLQSPTYLHAKGAGFVLVQDQAGSLRIDSSLCVWRTDNAPGGEQPVEELDQSAEDEADEGHGGFRWVDVSDLPTPIYELSPICPEKSDGQFYKKLIKNNERVGWTFYIASHNLRSTILRAMI